MEKNNVIQNIKEIQSCCVEILTEIDKICREHNIAYSLTGGSVIGAYLYNGFIPWDDDIDIMMTRDNYDKFLEVCNSELPNGYAVYNYENGKDKTILFSKVMNENTTVIELKADGEKVVEGVFVDITVFDKLPRHKVKRLYFFLLAKIMQCCRKRKYIFKLDIKNTVVNVIKFFVSPFAKQIYKYAKRKYINVKGEEYDFAEMMAGFTISFDKDLFDNYTTIKFVDKDFMIVEDYMKYLETRYGRREFYREQRPEDFPHHLIYVDCHQPYREYRFDDK